MWRFFAQSENVLTEFLLNLMWKKHTNGNWKKHPLVIDYDYIDYSNANKCNANTWNWNEQNSYRVYNPRSHVTNPILLDYGITMSAFR